MVKTYTPAERAARAQAMVDHLKVYPGLSAYELGRAVLKEGARPVTRPRQVLQRLEREGRVWSETVKKEGKDVLIWFAVST